MARLPTNIVAGQTGHVAHSNQAYELVNQINHPVTGSRIINVLDPPAAVSSVAAVGNNSTDDNVALQNIFDWLKGIKTHNHVVWFPFINAAGTEARYLTSKPLRVWTNTRIIGPATIKAHPSFDWVNHPYWQDPLYKPVGNPQPGDIAVMELWNDATARGGMSRIMIDDLTLDGANQAGSLGLFTKMQQPGYTRKLRINNCDTGWALWGQQSDHYQPIMVNCKVGIFLGPNVSGLYTFGAAAGAASIDCLFMTFYSLNIEQYTVAAIRMECEGPNWFYSAHFEGTQGATNYRVIDAREGAFHIKNGWATHPGDTNHIFVIGDKTPLPGRKNTNYTIEDFRLSATNVTGQLFIDDRVSGFTRIVGAQRYIDSFHRLFSNDTNVDWDASVEYKSVSGGTVRIGGEKGTTASPAGHTGAQLTVRANTAQDEATVRFQDSAAVTRAGVHQTGNLFLGSYTNASRPAATTLSAGTAIWNTDDAAPNFSDGTVWRDAMGIAT